MSGHSKWHNIQKTKGAADAKRSAAFTKIAKEIIVAVKQGGSGDPANNSRLATVIAKAKAANMPNDNIQNAIKKATGELKSTSFESMQYEGYAGGGIGLVVSVLTDNKNRAAAEIGHIFKRNGSEFAARGSVSRNFERKGQIVIEKAATDEDTLMGIVLDAGADDLESDEEGFTVSTTPSAFQDVMTALEKAGIATVSAEVEYVPTATKPLADLEQVKKLLSFVSALEDNEDVQNVYHDADIPDDVMEQAEDAE